MKSPTLPAPAMATRISGAPLRARADARSVSSAVTSAAKCRMSPSWPIALGVLDLRGAEAGDRDEPEHAGLAQRRELLARPLRRDRVVEQAHLAARVEPLVRLLLGGEQAAHHLVGGPRDRGDGRDAEALVDQRPPRVVDPGDDPLDREVLVGDAGGEDVGVVAAGHGGDGAGPLDAGLDRGGRGRSRSRRPSRPAKSLGQPLAERVGVLVDRPPPCGHCVSRLRASSLPTRPHPTTTTCTAVSLRRSGPAQAIERSRERAIGESPDDADRRIGVDTCRMASCPGPVEPWGSGGSDDVAFVKRVLVGRPLATTEMEHQRIPKTIALAVFSSDAISSTAYATEEILFVVAVGGSSLALGLEHARPDRDRGRGPARRSSSRRTARRSSPTRAAAAATSSAARTSARTRRSSRARRCSSTTSSPSRCRSPRASPRSCRSPRSRTREAPRRARARPDRCSSASPTCAASRSRAASSRCRPTSTSRSSPRS